MVRMADASNNSFKRQLMVRSKLIIQQQKSPAWYLGWGLVAVLLLTISFILGNYLSIESQRKMEARLQSLQNQLVEYEQAYDKVSKELVMQKQSSKVDELSSQKLLDDIKALKKRQKTQQEELKFYRNIMAPELSQQGLTIADFKLFNQKEDNAVKFKLVLTQAGKQEQFIKGNVTLTVTGQLNGQAVSYSFRELGTFQAKDFQFQFRYFQNIEGVIQLPEGVIAQKVSILAKTTGLAKNQTNETQFDWTLSD